MSELTAASLHACAALIDALDDAVLLADDTGRVRAANPRAAALLGRAGEDLRGLDIEALLAGTPARVSTGALTLDGVALALVTLREPALAPPTTDAIVGLDLDATITSWSDGAQRLYGYTQAEAVGQPAAMLTDAEHDAQLHEVLARVGRGEVVEQLETTRVAKDGRVLTVSLTVAPTHDATGAVVGAVTAARDITEHAVMIDELRRSNSDLEQFAYVASHDLSEPLRVIAGFVDLLARRYRGRLDEDADRFIDFIISGVERLQTLIDDLLAYSRAGRAELARQEVDTGEVVRDVLWALAPQMRERRAEVDVGELPAVRAERTMLRQIFQNLISNAIKFGDPNLPVVRVRAGRVPGAWRFDVHDNGAGINPRHTDRVFEMFQRLHGRDVPGSGMGLAIVKRLVERHGGRVWVTAGEPEGSIFSFTIPDRARSA